MSNHNHSNDNDDNHEDLKSTLLDWTSKQGRILTGNGLAEKYYTAERGFPFQDDELPHYHLVSNNNQTHAVFSSWAKAADEKKEEMKSDDDSGAWKKYPVCGAWTRPLFVGGFEHSTNENEIVFNVQTNTLFIDMRIPRLAKQILPDKNLLLGEEADKSAETVLKTMSNEQLQLYARRHAFAGYTILDHYQKRPVCTRHHCIDWNYVGRGRNRPNKWFVEMHPNHNNTWKEWAFAQDDFGQHYYWERWERLANDANGDGLVIALRKHRESDTDMDDGIIVVVGDHFNYIFARKLKGNENNYEKGNLVDLVDAALKVDDRDSAELYVSIDAGHGTVSSGWVIDCALQYWKEGRSLFSSENGTFVRDGTNMESCDLTWNRSKWDVYESSLQSMDDMDFLFQYNGLEDQSGRIFNIINGQNSNSRKRKKLR